MRPSFPAIFLALIFPLCFFPAESAPARKKKPSVPERTTGTNSAVKEKTEAAKEAPAKPETPPAPVAVDPEKWLSQSKFYQAGLKAMKGHMPDVAERHFRDLLKAESPKEVLPYINRQLGEACVRNGQYDEALHILKNNKDLADLTGSLFWEAMANKGKGNYSVALRLFNSLENDASLSPVIRISVLWQMAEIHALLGNWEQSIRVLKRLLEFQDEKIQEAAKLALSGVNLRMGKPDEARLLAQDILDSSGKLSIQTAGLAKLVLAQALIREDKPQEALDQLSALAVDGKLPVKVVTMAKIAAAKAEIALEKKGLSSEEGKGEDRLLSFIENEPDSVFIPEAFNILRETNAFSDPVAYGKLREWSEKNHTQRTPYALAVLSRILMEKGEGAGLPDIFIRAGEQFPNHPVVRDLQCLILQYLYDHQKVDEAGRLIETLPAGDCKTLFMEGMQALARKDYGKAAEFFGKAATSFGETAGGLEQSSLFNEYVSALEANLPDSVEKVEKNPLLKEDTYADLMLEKALDAASRSLPEAIKQLQRFLNTYPDHKRSADAWLALGELALYQEKGDENLTLKALEALGEMPLTNEEKERFSRLQVLLPEYSGQWAAAVQAAKEYLSQYPEPELQYPMQLKLGELLYRNNDFAQTHLYLQKLVSLLPQDSPYLAPALFLSAKASQQTNTQQSRETALTLFNRVAEMDSPYRAASVIEAASIMLRAGKEKEVIETLSSFVDEKNLAPESRRMALSLEAEAWEALASSRPEALAKACELTTEILKEDNLPTMWKNRTLFLQAGLSEKAGDNTSALRDYHLIISDPGSDDWYYKAGFDAMRLLEDMKNWQAAISLAEDMAKSGGARAEEAANRAKKIRLEHFVWEDKPMEEISDGKKETAPPGENPAPPEILTLPESLLNTPAGKDEAKEKQDS